MNSPAPGRRDALTARSLFRVERHIQDLFDLALIQCGGLTLCREPTPLPDVVVDVVDVVHDQATQRQLLLHVLPPQGAVLLSSDPERLFRLLENLLRCIIARTDVGGRVMIHTWSTGAHVALDVHGIAPGVPLDYYAMARLHTPPTSSVRQPGLPFKVARELLVAHGGWFAVQQVASFGTAFCCLIPQRMDAATAHHPS